MFSIQALLTKVNLGLLFEQLFYQNGKYAPLRDLQTPPKYPQWLIMMILKSLIDKNCFRCFNGEGFVPTTLGLSRPKFERARNNVKFYGCFDSFLLKDLSPHTNSYNIL